MSGWKETVSVRVEGNRAWKFKNVTKSVYSLFRNFDHKCEWKMIDSFSIELGQFKLCGSITPLRCLQEADVAIMKKGIKRNLETMHPKHLLKVQF
jgi:hypothetical protein